jgi:hypothetical protein
MDVAKVDRDVAYVAMVVHLCCKRLFPMYRLFFRRMLQMRLSECWICFTHMLQMFYLDVAYVLQWFSWNIFSLKLISPAYQAWYSVFLSQQNSIGQSSESIFIHMCVISRCSKSRLSVTSLSSPRCLLLFSMLVMFGRHGPVWGRRRGWARVGSSDVEPERARRVAWSRCEARGAASGYSRTELLGAIQSHLIISMNRTQRIIAMVGTWISLKIYANLMRFF